MLEVSRRDVGVATWRSGCMDVWSSGTLEAGCRYADVEAWKYRGWSAGVELRVCGREGMDGGMDRWSRAADVQMEVCRLGALEL